ncbi:MAG: D-alanyl-D-alanine carboxypeptidase [Oscillospiraceae bacterium]|nr:D-alanyl-D-alanine carboxypeptidase [Oscillospiraceae bacterium]
MKIRKILLFVLCFFLLAPSAVAAPRDAEKTEIAEPPQENSGGGAQKELPDIVINGQGAILLEAETGTVIYEKDADTLREPASITKVMTLLLVFEALEAGDIALTDIVTAPPEAKKIGGSTIFLEENEQMSVEDLLRGVFVNSANDATYTLACYLAGSEAAFVLRMNARAKELGMVNTRFANATGAFDGGDATHCSTARDISIMSRELLLHKQIFSYTSIWMDYLRDGKTLLANTNKLIHTYDGANGLKTGHTSTAGYCISASAKRDGVTYIAVVLGAKSEKDRFADAATLLDYAFANYTLVDAQGMIVLPPVAVALSKSGYAPVRLGGQTKFLLSKAEAKNITPELKLNARITAPLKAGDVLGTVTLKNSSGAVIGTVNVTAAQDCPKATLTEVLSRLFLNLLGKK